MALRVPMIKVSALGTEAVLLGAMAVGLTKARDLVFERAVAQAPSG